MTTRASDLRFEGGGRMVKVCGICRQPLSKDGRCPHLQTVNEAKRKGIA